jgi:hypothetical protein
MGVKIRLTVVSLVPLVALMFVAGSRVIDGRRFVRDRRVVGDSRRIGGSRVADRGGSRDYSVIFIRRGSRCLRG